MAASVPVWKKRELRNPRIKTEKQKEEKINVKATKEIIDFLVDVKA